ncbi:unnamed protein product [Spirodela intermedia]|uniref:Uncharacterized protein n=2 Tax=Spirodela intermedia TaxID=51605 RepID=A0A7I8IJN1_SPIIN|nr:unnamed protein product [Spirodela intermedia]CAA6658048.1 unnamed protein product [Spirodela intermedia]CAA7394182.1 unnamed protein product [Spirodela intermedia]
MAFVLSKSNLFSSLRGNPQVLQEQQIPLSRRGFHVELGAREKALLEEDPALKKFKSHKKSLARVKKFGDALIIVVVAACSYEIYASAVEKRAKFAGDDRAKNI